MKASQQEGQLFSDSIDQINNGIEAIINLYNDLELDQPFIQFDQEVLERIEKVKAKYGEAFVDQKINAVVKEVIEWLPLDENELEVKTTKPVRRKKADKEDEVKNQESDEVTKPEETSLK